jgi:hypothetical protein
VKGLKVSALVVLLLFAGLVGAAEIVRVVDGFAKPDLAVNCRAAQTGRCFTRERGVVEPKPTDVDVSVTYDDGLRSTTLNLRGGASPARGTRVLLERWNGDTVALYDPVTEHRYRTVDWPVRWSVESFVLPLGLVLAVLTCVGALFRGIVRTARS